MANPQEYIRNLTPYVPGKPIEELQREFGIQNVTKLASNENAVGPSPLALAAIVRELAELHRYPEGSAPTLVSELAAFLQVDPSNVVLGNGSDELIKLILQAFCPRNGVVVSSEHGFLMYKVFAGGFGIRCAEPPLAQNYRYDLRAVGAVAKESGAHAVFLANPSNPTGTTFTQTELLRFCEDVGPDLLLIIDEAYYEYVEMDDAVDSLTLLRNRPNTVILRTFSKAYGLAGLRVGYGITSSEIANYINRIRTPFNINRLAQVGATAALGDKEHLAQVLEVNRAGKIQITRGLRELGLNFADSQTNFYLVDLNRPAGPVYEALLRMGLIVRPMTAYGFPCHIRITVGQPAENARVLSALRAVLAE